MGGGGGADVSATIKCHRWPVTFYAFFDVCLGHLSGQWVHRQNNWFSNSVSNKQHLNGTSQSPAPTPVSSSAYTAHSLHNTHLSVPCIYSSQSHVSTPVSPLHTHLSVPSIHTCQSPAYKPVNPLHIHLSVPCIHTCQSPAYTPVSPLYPHCQSPVYTHGSHLHTLLSVPCTHTC